MARRSAAARLDVFLPALATSQEATAIRRRLGEASSTVPHAGRLQHLATSLGSATCPASWSANAS